MNEIPIGHLDGLARGQLSRMLADALQYRQQHTGRAALGEHGARRFAQSIDRAPDASRAISARPRFGVMAAAAGLGLAVAAGLAAWPSPTSTRVEPTRSTPRLAASAPASPAPVAVGARPRVTGAGAENVQRRNP